MFQAQKDAWRVWVLWSTLTANGEMRTKPLAKQLKLHKRTVSDILAGMVHMGHVESTDRWTWRATDKAPPEQDEPVESARMIRERATRKAAKERRAAGIFRPLPIPKVRPAPPRIVLELDRVWPDPYFKPSIGFMIGAAIGRKAWEDFFDAQEQRPGPRLSDLKLPDATSSAD